MLRTLLRETLWTAALLLVVSLASFAALDAALEVDWWGTAAPGARAGLSRVEAIGRGEGTARIWLSPVPDARYRTERDLEALRAPPTREAAADRIVARGTAALPSLLEAVSRSRGAPDPSLLAVLARLAPVVAPASTPPAAPAEARAYWDSFDALRGLDFRAVYAARVVRRVHERGGRNAATQLERLGSFAVPALCDALEAETDDASTQRLIEALALVDARGPRVDSLSPEALRASWRAWCFARRLGYERLETFEQSIAPVQRARFGLWWSAFVRGTLGPSLHSHVPVLRELRERLPASILCGGLGGLLATALALALGGRDRRGAAARALEFFGALVPGLAAFALGYLALLQILAPGRAASLELLRVSLASQPLRLALAALLSAVVGALWLRRSQSQWLVGVVRAEAESWARESRSPVLRQILRHGARVGVASLLMPLGLAGLALPSVSVLIEPLLGLRGMGSLTLWAIVERDAPWLMIVAVTAVPLGLAGRWSRLLLLWAVAPAERSSTVPPPPPSAAPIAVTPADATRASPDALVHEPTEETR